MQISQVINKLNRILINCDLENDISANLYQKSIRYARQDEHTSFVTIVANWVPGLPHIKALLTTFGVPF